MRQRFFSAWRTADRTHLIGAIAVLVLGVIALSAAASMPSDWSTAIEDRQEQGKNPRVEDFAKTWSWFAAVSNGWLLTLAGAVGAGIVLRYGKMSWLSSAGTLQSKNQTPISTYSRRWAVGALLILLLALGVRWPRMDLSLYYDEGYSLLRYIDGDFKRKPGEDYEGSLPGFEQVSWTDTFFGNRHGNNNVLQSLLSRVCNDTWKRVSGAVDGQINETALRLPVLIFGVASIGLLGRLLFWIAPYWVSWLGMFWAAVHPWHVRYSTEARGYGIAFFFMLGALGALVRAIETNRFRWWLTFLLCQVGYMYAFPGAASFALALSGAVVAWLIARKIRGDTMAFCRSRFLALVLANAASVLIFWQLMAPCIPQLRQAVATFWSMGGGPEPGWWTDLPFHLVYGRPWIETFESLSILALDIWSRAVASSSTGNKAILIGGVLGVFAIAGTGWWSNRDRLVTWLMGGTLLAAPIAYGISLATDSILQKWYVVYLVLPVAFLFALGWPRMVQHLKTRGLLAAMVVAGLIVWGSIGPLRVYQRTSKENLKEVVQFARGGSETDTFRFYMDVSEGQVYPFENESELPILAAVWSWSTRLYDPYLRIVESEKDLDRFIAEASAAGRDLFVTVGEIEKAREHLPDVLLRLEGKDEFRLALFASGLEDEKFTQRIFRYVPK